jgi:hypothetical protein
VPVAGSPTGSGAGWFESPLNAFAAVAGQLVGLLGNPERPEPGLTPSMTWLGLPNLVVALKLADEGMDLWFINPLHQEHMDAAIEAEADADDRDEDDIDEEEQQDEGDAPRVRTAEIASTSWEQLAEGVAVTLSRMPRHQVLIFNASGGRFVHFEYAQSVKRGVELRCHVAPNLEIDNQFRMATADEAQLEASGWARPRKDGDNWQRSVSWPATTVAYERAAQATLFILRDLLYVADPSELQVEAWIDWSSKAADLSALDVVAV